MLYLKGLLKMGLQISSNLSKRTVGLVILSSLLVGCGGGGSGRTNASTQPLPALPSPSPSQTVDTTVTPESAALDLLNQNRETCGFGALVRNKALDTTALNHANYMAHVTKTNLYPYASHYEQSDYRSDGTTFTNTGITNPYYSGQTLADRINPTTLGSEAIPTSYKGLGYGENIALTNLSPIASNYVSNSVNNAKDMLTGLFAAPYHIRTLVYHQFNELGLDYQEIKWTANTINNQTNLLEMVSALSADKTYVKNNKLLNFPCDGVTTAYQLTHEQPNPIKDRDLEKNPIGQPIYVLAPDDKVITSASATLTENGISIAIPHVILASNDPNNILDKVNDRNEAIFMPDQPLKPDTVYVATYQLTYADGETVSRTFSFRTKSKT